MKLAISIPSLVVLGCTFLVTDSAYAQRANQTRTSTSSSSSGSTFPTSNIQNMGPTFQTGSNGATSGFNQSQQNGRVGIRGANQNLVGTNNFGQGTGQNTGRRNRGNGNNQNVGMGMNPFGQQNFGNQNFGNFGQNSLQAKRTIQPQHRVAFSYALPTSTNVSGKIEKILAPHPKAKVQVRNLNVISGEEGVVTLRGEVASEEYKQLAGMMVQFEPGVRQVKNELVVRSGEHP